MGVVIPRNTRKTTVDDVEILVSSSPASCNLTAGLKSSYDGAVSHAGSAHAPSNANYYEHPSSHAPGIITQNVSNRFVSDTEKSTWNGKEPGNANIQTHVTAGHAPSDAQKNSDITKAEIEAKLTGTISTHAHAGGSGDVVGPASAIGDNIAVFNLTTGKLIKDGGATIASKENTGVAASTVSTHAALKTGAHGLLNSIRIRPQVTPTAKTAAVTLTIAELLTGIITGNPAAAAAYTLPTGTLCDAGMTIAVDEAFEWVLSNIATTATYIITLTAATGHTIVGCPKVPSNSATTGGLWGTASATFRTRKTATNTFITYRIG